MSNLSDMGEFGFIEAMRNRLAEPPRGWLGIGDDCAVIPASGFPLLLSCDLSIEGVHFRRETASPVDIGWKAAASAFSDIAAMGGTPVSCLIALACPAATDTAFLEGLYDGLSGAAMAAGAVIAGGDTTKSLSGIAIDVSVTGEAREGRWLSRAGARDGDILAVIGQTGLSSAGLHALEHGFSAPEALLEAHRRPAPCYAEGRWLCRQDAVHALIDVSDGLAQDAGHLGEASGLAAIIKPAQIRLDPVLAVYCVEHALDALTLALTGGEDYALAAAIDPDGYVALAESFAATFPSPVTAVGRFARGTPGWAIEGRSPVAAGFDHFRSGGGSPSI